MHLNNPVKLSGLAVAAVLMLSGCGSAASTTNTGGSDGELPASSSASPKTSAGAPAAESTSSGSYKVASWALPLSDAGQKLGSMKGDSFSVDIFQVATDVASKDSILVDNKTKESLLKKGAPIVYINYIVTNTSSTDLTLGQSLVKPTAKYADWKYVGGMPSDSNSGGFKKHNLTSSGITLQEKDPFVLKPGESFNIAENFAYTAGKEIEIRATMSPEDEDGRRDPDKKETAETTVTLK